MLALLVLLAGCGDDGRDTPFGDADEVRAYRSALNPLIDAVSAIETEVAARAIDADSVAIDSRLNAVYVEVRPRLVAVHETFQALRPPRRLTGLHAEIERLITLRLQAYQLVLDAYAAGQIDRYPEAVALLRQANELIPAINEQLHAVDDALAGRDDGVLAASAASVEPGPPAIAVGALAAAWQGAAAGPVAGA